MKSIWLVCLLSLAICQTHGRPLIGDLMGSIAEMGKGMSMKAQEMVSNGASAIQEAVQAGSDTTNTALNGVGTVGKETIQGAANVGRNILGMLGMVRKVLGPMGQPIHAVEEFGNQMIETGVSAGTKAIELSGSLASRATNTADKIADMTADAIKGGAKASTDMITKWIDQVLSQLVSVISLFMEK